MNSTGVTYPDILKSRLAIGHSGGQEVGLEFILEALQPAHVKQKETRRLRGL